MYTLRTSEIRFFMPGQPGRAIRRWLERTGYPERDTETRTDRYLLTDSRYAGIKLREGRLENKVFLHRVLLPDALNLAGEGGTWLKVSTALPGSFSPCGEWAEVEKQRKVAGYLPQERRWLRAGEEAKDSCQVETGYVGYKDRRFFSICFEATGGGESPERGLWDTLQQLILPGESKIFGNLQAFSYPEWLIAMNGRTL